ncbi:MULTISPECIES: hypothetical protein [Gordonia]|uniref:hypothetical protein n=1 Tax=Gordonia TaxID=2053 RepID=UPI0022E9819C|nr:MULTISPECIES: hypothetical protein [Gordonia]
MTERARALAWPLFAVSGLLIVAFSLVSWGDSSQGLNSKISGVGRVSVPGAAPEDVAFLEAHTQRPGLVTIILGAVIAAVAAVGWWRRRLRPIALSVIGPPRSEPRWPRDSWLLTRPDDCSTTR